MIIIIINTLHGMDKRGKAEVRMHLHMQAIVQAVSPASGHAPELPLAHICRGLPLAHRCRGLPLAHICRGLPLAHICRGLPLAHIPCRGLRFEIIMHLLHSYSPPPSFCLLLRYVGLAGIRTQLLLQYVGRARIRSLDLP